MFYDKAGSGKLDYIACEKLLQHLGLIDEEANQFMLLADPDDRGYITVADFMKAVTTEAKQVPLEEDLSKVFRLYDRNADGNISRDEFWHIMNVLGHKISESDVEALFKRVSRHKEGLLSLADFTKLMIDR